MIHLDLGDSSAVLIPHLRTWCPEPVCVLQQPAEPLLFPWDDRPLWPSDGGNLLITTAVDVYWRRIDGRANDCVLCLDPQIKDPQQQLSLIRSVLLTDGFRSAAQRSGKVILAAPGRILFYRRRSDPLWALSNGRAGQ